MTIPAITPAQPLEEVAKLLDVTLETGLSQTEAHKRLSTYGPNVIEQKKTTLLTLFLRQFSSPFIYLLIGATVLSLALGNVLDAILISIFLTINTGLGFFQEYKSDKSIALLQSYIAPQVTVRRDGVEMRVKAREIVPGDILLLRPGVKLTADTRITTATGLLVNESILTGESAPAAKVTSPMTAVPENVYAAVNTAFSGTTVSQGYGEGIVIRTGSTSAVGTIAHFAQETKKVGEYAAGINRLSVFLLRFIIATVVCVFFANIAVKGASINIIELLIFSIALIISVIPEALPLVITVSLSSGAVHLAKQHVVVKRLSAIEDLGGIDVLCTDKTGTVTENVLTVVDTLPCHTDLSPVFAAALAIDETSNIFLDPFDIALIAALDPKEKALFDKRIIVDKIPFDPVRRRNAVLVESNGVRYIITRGAPEDVVSCAEASNETKKILEWSETLGHEGHRSIAIAYRQATSATKKLSADICNVGLTVAGAISFEDPLKPTTQRAVDAAKRLHVAIKIVTGDAEAVAAAVGRHIGLVTDDAQVIRGDHFMALSEEAQREKVESCTVFARVTPEMKHRIISLLAKTHTVGFLGEGINDAPALKAATVSLVVESASDIAREAADIVLLQKDLSVIIDGIKEGRKIFANTTKYIKATLTSNFGNFYAVAVSTLLIPTLPMLPAQILLLNLLSDSPMIAIAKDHVDDEEVERPVKYKASDIVLFSLFLGIISTFFDFLFFAVFVRTGGSHLQTYWFLGSLMTELVLLFSIRTRQSIFKGSRPSKSLVGFSLLAATVGLALPFLSWGRATFQFVYPTPGNLGLVFGIVALYFVATETTKVFITKRFKGHLDITAQ